MQEASFYWEQPYLQGHVLVVLVGLHLERLLAHEVALVTRQVLGDLPDFFRRTIAAAAVTKLLVGRSLVPKHGSISTRF